jgi:signal transduction histidine kinase
VRRAGRDPGSLKVVSKTAGPTWPTEAVAELFKKAAGAIVGQRVDEILTAGPKLVAELRKALDGRPGRSPPLPAHGAAEGGRNGHGRSLGRTRRIGPARLAGREPLSARLAAVVGHELRAPLATALMYMGILERQIDAGVGGASLRSALAVAREELLRIERLIVRVTELQRLGRPVLRPRLVDIGRIVDATVRRALLGDPTSRVTVSAAPRGLNGWWDDAAIEQIVQNLLSNALKFGAGRPIRITVEPAAEGVRLVVRDRGIGISASDLERIFRCHVRAPVERSGGLGLGLWLVRALAEAHGGKVTVQSRLGQGSTFTVALRPLRRPSRAADEDGTPARQHA